VTYIKVDRQEDLDWLRKYIRTELEKNLQGRIMAGDTPASQSKYEYLLNWDRYLRKSTDGPILTMGPADVVPLPQPKPAARRGRPPGSKNKKKSTASRGRKSTKTIEPPDPYQCAVHKDRKGKRRPTDDCERCWEIFKIFNPQTYRQKRAEFDLKRRQIG
jgi:hypothetical protein